jgi:hypothetical protein
MAWETQNSGAGAAPPQSASPISKIPPSPVEVVIRTMESDIKSLSQSGGIGRPQGEALKLNDPVAGHSSSYSTLKPILFVFLGLIVLAGAIYFSFFYRR